MELIPTHPYFTTVWHLIKQSDKFYCWANKSDWLHVRKPELHTCTVIAGIPNTSRPLLMVTSFLLNNTRLLSQTVKQSEPEGDQIALLWDQTDWLPTWCSPAAWYPEIFKVKIFSAFMPRKYSRSCPQEPAIYLCKQDVICLFIYLLFNWLAVNSSNYKSCLLRIIYYLQFFHLIKLLIFSLVLPSQICNKCCISTF